MIAINSNPDKNVIFYKTVNRGTTWRLTKENNLLIVWRVEVVDLKDDDSDWNSEIKKIFSTYARSEAIEYCVTESLKEVGAK